MYFQPQYYLFAEKSFPESFAGCLKIWRGLSVWLVNPSYPAFELPPQVVLLADEADLISMRFMEDDDKNEFLAPIRKSMLPSFSDDIVEHMAYLLAWEDFRKFLSPWPNTESDPTSPLYSLIRGRGQCLAKGPEANTGPILAQANIGIYKETNKGIDGWHELLTNVVDFGMAGAMREWREAYSGHEPFGRFQTKLELQAWMDSFVENNFAKWELSITGDSDIEITSIGLEDGLLLPAFTVCDLSSSEPQGIHMLVPRQIHRAYGEDAKLAFVDGATEQKVIRL